MNILFHASFANKDEFLKSLKKKFIHHKIFTLNQNIKLDKIEVALVWNLPDKILEKLKNLKIIFSINIINYMKIFFYHIFPLVTTFGSNFCILTKFFYFSFIRD